MEHRIELATIFENHLKLLQNKIIGFKTQLQKTKNRVQEMETKKQSIVKENHTLKDNIKRIKEKTK